MSRAKAIIWAAKSWQARRAPAKVSLAPVRLAPTEQADKAPNLRYYMPGLDPEDVTGGNGDG